MPKKKQTNNKKREARKGGRTVDERQFMKGHCGEVLRIDKRKEDVGKPRKEVS
jgi:hypothetical protein